MVLAQTIITTNSDFYFVSWDIVFSGKISSSHHVVLLWSWRSYANGTTYTRLRYIEDVGFLSNGSRERSISRSPKRISLQWPIRKYDTATNASVRTQLSSSSHFAINFHQIPWLDFAYSPLRLQSLSRVWFNLSTRWRRNLQSSPRHWVNKRGQLTILVSGLRVT